MQVQSVLSVKDAYGRQFSLLNDQSTVIADNHSRKSETMTEMYSDDCVANEPTRSRYSCSINGCTKSFTTSGHLARHKRIHTGEKKHPCLHPGCPSRFSRHDNMMQHYRTHMAPKRFKYRQKPQPPLRQQGLSSVDQLRVCEDNALAYQHAKTSYPSCGNFVPFDTFSKLQPHAPPLCLSVGNRSHEVSSICSTCSTTSPSSLALSHSSAVLSPSSQYRTSYPADISPVCAGIHCSGRSTTLVTLPNLSGFVHLATLSD